MSPNDRRPNMRLRYGNSYPRPSLCPRADSKRLRRRGVRERFWSHMAASALRGSSLGQPQMHAFRPLETNTFGSLNALFGVLDRPRTRHRHTLVLRKGRKTFVLANARLSPYLPKEHFVSPHDKLQMASFLLTVPLLGKYV